MFYEKVDVNPLYNNYIPQNNIHINNNIYNNCIRKNNSVANKKINNNPENIINN